MIKGLAPIYDQLFPIEGQAHAFFLAQLEHETSNTRPPFALDVGCGTGALLALAAEKGWRGLGIDPDLDMVQIARARLSQHAGMEISKGTMQDKLPSGVADRLFCTGNTICFCKNLHELRTIFTGFRSALREDGRLIIQIINWDRIDLHGTYEFPVLSVLSGGTEYAFHRRYIPVVAGQRMLFETELCTNAGRVRTTAEMTVIPAETLRRIARETHFQAIQLLGSFAGERWSKQSPLTLLTAEPA